MEGEFHEDLRRVGVMSRREKIQDTESAIQNPESIDRGRAPFVPESIMPQERFVTGMNGSGSATDFGWVESPAL
jgi:hypothetical protein